MDNILITGAEFDNKGAQSMLLTLLYILKKAYPSRHVIVLTKNPNSKMDSKLNAQIVFESNLYIAKKAKTVLSVFWLYYSKIRHRKTIDREVYRYYLEVLNKSSIVYDISGYSFGEQWKFSSNYLYLMRLKVYNSLNIKTILLPQSFGNFDKSFYLNKMIFNLLSKKYFPLCERIYAREKEGYENLKRYSTKNIELANDIVLDFGNLTKEAEIIKFNQFKTHINYNIKENSVGVIPNTKLLKYLSLEKLLDNYEIIINKILKQNKNVYLIYHANQDCEFLKILKNRYSDQLNVHFVFEELNSYQLKTILSKMNYNVASRYHSIVHSFIGLRPCIVIGWSQKYYELLENFSTTKLLIDLRHESLSKNKLILMLDTLDKTYVDQSNTIKKALEINRNYSMEDLLLVHNHA